MHDNKTIITTINTYIILSLSLFKYNYLYINYIWVNLILSPIHRPTPENNTNMAQICIEWICYIYCIVFIHSMYSINLLTEQENRRRRREGGASSFFFYRCLVLLLPSSSIDPKNKSNKYNGFYCTTDTTIVIIKFVNVSC